MGEHPGGKVRFCRVAGSPEGGCKLASFREWMQVGFVLTITSGSGLGSSFQSRRSGALIMARLKVIVAMLVFSGVLVLGTGLIAQQNTGVGVAQSPVDPTIKSLIEARIKVAQEIFETTMAPPRNGSLDDMPEWS